MRLESCLCALAVLPALASDAALAASAPPPAPIEERVRAAELIVEGTVVAVETRLSDADAASPFPIPHTFVRYRVERVLKGAVENGEITLRFVGGPIDRDRFLTLSGAPLFDVGDRDVLLAQSNLAAECPLVDCAAGRFRMVEDMLVSEEGRRLQLSDDGQIVDGPAMKLDAIDTTRMSDSIRLERVEIPDPGEVILDPRDPAVRAGLDPQRDLSPERFVAYLETVVQAAHTQEELDRSARAPMRSADPRVRFTVRSPLAQSPAPESATGGSAAPASFASRAPADLAGPGSPGIGDPTGRAVAEGADLALAGAVSTQSRSTALGAGALLLLATTAGLALRRAMRVR
jgi:hypothetical protein